MLGADDDSADLVAVAIGLPWPMVVPFTADAAAHKRGTVGGEATDEGECGFTRGRLPHGVHVTSCSPPRTWAAASRALKGPSDAGGLVVDFAATLRAAVGTRASTWEATREAAFAISPFRFGPVVSRRSAWPLLVVVARSPFPDSAFRPVTGSRANIATAARS